MLQCVIDLSLWIAGVLNTVYVSGLRGPNSSSTVVTFFSVRALHASVCRSYAFSQCFFSKSLLVKCLVCHFAVYF